MPARVDYRMGSIFDEECDLLVVPSSTEGTVTPSMAEQLRAAQVTVRASTMPWGGLAWHQPRAGKYRFVAYAATTKGTASSAGIIEALGSKLGKLAQQLDVRTITTPLLGSDSMDLAPAAAAEALANGFQQSAPDAAVLTIHIRDPWTFQAVTGRTGEKTGNESTAWSHPRPPAPAAPAQPETAPAPTEPRRTRVFISYSHADAPWLERLQKHLRPLERDGALIWADTRIKAGDRWRDEIREALEETRVAILLISADFMASEFIDKNELPPLLKAAEDDGATILPVIVSPSRFERTPSLSCFQAVNDPQKPLVQLRRGNREKVLDAVARAVEDALTG